MEQILPFIQEVEPEQLEIITVPPIRVALRIRNAFKVRMIPFSRAKEALKLVQQDIENYGDEERIQLKIALVDLEQEILQLKEKLD